MPAYDSLDQPEGLLNEDDGNVVGGMRLTAGLSLAQLTSSDGGDLIDPVYDEDQLRLEVRERGERCYSGRYRKVLSEERFQNFDISMGFEEIKTRMKELREGINSMILTPGSGSEHPPDRSCVTIHYEILIEGQDEPFDSTFIRGMPERFKLNCGNILPGFEIVIQSMKVGDVSLSILAPEFAFGRIGSPPRIPGDCEVLAVIKLLNMTPESEGEKLLQMEQSCRLSLSWSSVLAAVNAEHTTGNHFAESEEWKLAIYHYNFALRLLEEKIDNLKNEEPGDCRGLAEKLYLNKAHCHLKLEQPKRAMEHCRKALKLNARSLKGNLRMAKACLVLEMFSEARDHLILAQKLEPHNLVVEQELSKLNRKMTEMNRQEKILCKKIFSAHEKIEPVEQDEETWKQSKIFHSLKKAFFNEEEGCQVEEICIPALPSHLETVKKCVKHLNLKLRLTADDPQKLCIMKKQN